MRPIILVSLLALGVLALVGETPAHAQGADAAAAATAGAQPDAAAPAAPLVTSDIAPTPAPAAAPVDPPAPAPAPAPAPTKDAGSLASDVVAAVRGGQWRLAIAGILGLLMLGLAKVRNHPRSPFKGDRGGAALVLVLSLAGAFGTALASSAPLGLDLVVGALGAALTAAGGYSVLRKLIWPKVA